MDRNENENTVEVKLSFLGRKAVKKLATRVTLPSLDMLSILKHSEDYLSTLKHPKHW